MKPNNDTPSIRFAGFTDAWEQRECGELMEVTSVRRIHQSDWKTEGIRFLRARDIVAAIKNEEVSDYLYISEEKYEECSKISGKVAVGDLLVTGVGTIGVPYLISNNAPVYFKDGNIIWFKNNNAINGTFFYYSFISDSIQNFISESAGIGTVGTYTIETGKKTPIALPNHKEQQKIGSYFANLDTLITLHQRKYDQLVNIKKSMLEKMFPKNGELVPEVRFAGFTDAWEQLEVGEWGDFYYGKSAPKWSVSDDAPTPCIRYGELYTKFGCKVDRVYSYTNIPPEKLVFSKGTEVLVPRVGEDPMDYNHCTWLSLKGVAIGEMISVYNTQQNPLFTAIMFNATLQEEFAKRVEGGSVTNLYYDKLKNITVSFPTLAEQSKIAAVFENIDTLITLHQRKLERLQNIKKACLEKMFV